MFKHCYMIDVLTFVELFDIIDSILSAISADDRL
jgi:hypothetical protein